MKIKTMNFLQKYKRHQDVCDAGGFQMRSVMLFQMHSMVGCGGTPSCIRLSRTPQRTSGVPFLKLSIRSRFRRNVFLVPMAIIHRSTAEFNQKTVLCI